MSFTGGKLKLKGNKTVSDVVKQIPGVKPEVNDKRKREDSPPKKEETKSDKPVTKVATLPAEVEEKLQKKRIIVDFKTDYEKKIALQKQHILKDQIEKKLKSTHR